MSFFNLNCYMYLKAQEIAHISNLNVTIENSKRFSI